MADAKRIGIARTLVHFLDGFDWQTFFEKLGCRVEVSRESDAGLFSCGSKFAANDQCYPVKMFYGHVLDLRARVDAIFIPQLVSLKQGTYGCPKVIALPQLIANTLEDIPPVIWTPIDMNDRCGTVKSLKRLCRSLTGDSKAIRAALEWFGAKMDYLLRNRTTITRYVFRDGSTVRNRRIGVIGHGYSLDDPMLNMRLLDKIGEYGFDYVTSNDIETMAERELNPFGYRHVHWDFGQHIIEAAHRFNVNNDIAGIIFITYFGCGIDSFMEEVFRDRLSGTKPYLSLSIDEHSGEAGLVTRIEAFLDMIELKTKAARMTPCTGR